MFLALRRSAWALLLAVSAYGQEGYTTPQVIVEVQSTGPFTQYLDIAFAPSAYPRKKIEEHLAILRAETKQPVASVSYQENIVPFADGSKEKVIHVRCTTSGLVNGPQGAVDFQAICRAFASFQNIEVRVMFPGFMYKGFGTYRYPRSKPLVTMEAVPDQEGVDARIHLNTHDPSAIMIPSVYQEPKPPAAPPPPPSKPIGLYVAAIIGLSLLAGLLVYYLLRFASTRER